MAQGLPAAEVAAGEHVAVMLLNRPEIVFVTFALARIGAIAVPVNTAYHGPALRNVLAGSDCTALIVDSRYADRLPPVTAELPDLRLTVVCTPGDRPAATGGNAAAPQGGRTVGWPDLMAHGAARPSGVHRDIPAPALVDADPALLRVTRRRPDRAVPLRPHGRAARPPEPPLVDPTLRVADRGRSGRGTDGDRRGTRVPVLLSRAARRRPVADDRQCHQHGLPRHRQHHRRSQFTPGAVRPVVRRPQTGPGWCRSWSAAPRWPSSYGGRPATPPAAASRSRRRAPHG
ncbi:AMP-binding protein [Streptomyces rimosus]|uniref:AMP-binding protein n=1 Tax=Streptomyces rimosus TaxID=1927 RepID=UPI00373FDEDC